MALRWWLFLVPLLLACQRGQGRFPYGKGYTFVNRWGDTVALDSLRGRTLVVSYFYTHCPDACPLTMANLKKLYFNLPDSLREYAKMYRIDSSGWMFLTGNPKGIRRFIKDVGVIAVKGNTEVAPNGDTVYFLTHTDYVHVVTPDGRIVYRGDGEKLNLKEVKEKIISTLP